MSPATRAPSLAVARDRVRHFVLTRSAYGPEWAAEANRRRLAITAACTSRLMAAQTTTAWTWLVLLDHRDPLLPERLAVFEAGAPGRVVPILWEPTDVAAAPWDKHGARTTHAQRVAATAYRAPWAQAIGDRRQPLLQTRLDDDDGLAPTTLARVQRAALRMTARTVLMHPIGYRTWQGRATAVRHPENAMHTLFTPAGDTLGVYDYGHRLVARVAPVRTVDMAPAWLWVRHPDTISGHRQADHPITLVVRRLFPVDWAALA